MAKKTDDETSVTGGGMHLPADPELWEMRHDRIVLAAIERWWSKVPPKCRRRMRAYLGEVFGQRDLEEGGK